MARVDIQRLAEAFRGVCYNGDDVSHLELEILGALDELRAARAVVDAAKAYRDGKEWDLRTEDNLWASLDAYDKLINDGGER